MAKVPIDQCPAGQAMDAAVAEALGLKVEWRRWADEMQPVYLAGTYANEYDDWAEHEDWRSVLPYSADIAAAWELGSKLSYCSYLKITSYSLGHAEVDLAQSANGGFEHFETEAETAPLAICRAFLKANGVEYVEMPDD